MDEVPIVRSVATYAELATWARDMRTTIHKLSHDIHGNQIYVAHTEHCSLVCKVPPEGQPAKPSETKERSGRGDSSELRPRNPFL